MIAKHHQIIATTSGLFANVVDADGEIFASIPLRQGVTLGREIMPYLVDGATLVLPAEAQHLVPPPRIHVVQHEAHADSAAQPFQPRPISDMERRLNDRLRASEASMSRMMAELRARGDTAPVAPPEPPSADDVEADDGEVTE